MAKVLLQYMYRDGDNYKDYFEIIVDTDLHPSLKELANGHDFEMGKFGTPTEKEFFANRVFDKEVDHNLFEVCNWAETTEHDTSPLLYQNIKDKIVFKAGNSNERLKKLENLVSFGETLCVLTECKETEYSNRCEGGLSTDMENMAECWDILIACAISFEEALVGVEWDGEWYECLESYYADVVSPKIFLNN